MESYEQTFAYNQGTYDLYRFLREYRSSLPAGRRFRIVGIDIEHQRDMACLYMQRLLTDAQPAPEIAGMLEKLRVEEHYWNPAFAK